MDLSPLKKKKEKLIKMKYRSKTLVFLQIAK